VKTYLHSIKSNYATTPPGIGVGHLIVIFHNHKATATQPPYTIGVALLFAAAGLIFAPSTFKSIGGTLFVDGEIIGIEGFPIVQYTIKPL
jgi:hypothetical protein